MSPGGLFSAGTAVSLTVGALAVDAVGEPAADGNADVVGIGVVATEGGCGPVLAPFPHPPRMSKPATSNDLFMGDDARKGAVSSTPTPGKRIVCLHLHKVATMTPDRTAPRSLGLRSQIRNSIVLVATLSLLLFGFPLAVVLGRLIDSQARTTLRSDATRAVAAIPDNVVQAGTAIQAPPSLDGTAIGVYDVLGRRIAGDGPVHSSLAGQIADGREHDGHDAGSLSVVVPVLSDTTVAGSIRAAIPVSVVSHRVYLAWTLLAALAIVVVTVAVLLARRAARRISTPFEDLTVAARAIGDGDYAIDLAYWGIPEADTAGTALRDSAQRIDALIHHEREFVGDASHQLRTPLAAMFLSLEQVPPDVASALERAKELQTTMADLLSVRGEPKPGRCDPAAVVSAAVQRWNTSARRVTLRSDHVGDVAMSGAALRQSLDVLLDNAIRHGADGITVTVEPLGDSVVVEVADQGPGFRNDAIPGTGLQLAARTVERAGGSLLIRRRVPHARVALLVPQATAAEVQSTSKR